MASLSIYFSKATIDLHARPLAPQLRVCQITQSGFQGLVTKPQLNRSCRDAVGVVHRRKRLAEPMENPMLTARGVLAGNRLAIQRACTMTAVESSRQCSFLQHPEEMTFG